MTGDTITPADVVAVAGVALWLGWLGVLSYVLAGGAL